jgi:N-carbamoyl-L-amino-acid hydrolase
MTRNLPTSATRIGDDIATLAAITDPDRPYTRRAFTPTFEAGRNWLAQTFANAGLTCHVDAAGNLVGRREGQRPGRGTIMIGSHSDTVPDGGRFDGIAGVIAALEVARALDESGITLEHDFEVVDFLAEEVSIFGVSCIGSRGITGQRPDDWLTRQADGITLAQGIDQVGGSSSANLVRNDVVAFLELHIEQGPVLEAGDLDIGVVTAIAGITRIEIVVEGRPDHAGTTPMGTRQDALAAASWIVLAVERFATELASGDAHFAATVGEFRMEPNAANVVPSRVRLLIDARAEHRPDMERFIEELGRGVAGIAAQTGVAIADPVVISDNPPTPCDPDLLDHLDRACEETGATHRRMASGAGHDTAWMARVTRAAMIFVPCVGGRSHTPEEDADIDDIALGAAVLMAAVLRLDKSLGETD